MHTLYDIAAIGNALQLLKEKIHPSKWAETPLPVIAAPGWWIERVSADFGGGEGDTLDQIHGCKIVQQNALASPVLVDHDGKTYALEAATATGTTATQ
jgi:hypothetical protein